MAFHFILRYKLAFLCGAGLQVRQKLLGGISSERSEMCILSNKRAPFGWAEVDVTQNVRGGVSSDRPKMYIFLSA